MTIKLKVVVDDIFEWDGVNKTILREDMYQATYDVYGIDCGRYGEYGDGTFITYLIKDYNWDAPILKIFTQNLHDARWSIQVCKEYLAKELKSPVE